MRHDEFAGNAYPQGEQPADQPIYPIMHRPAQIVPYGGYHQPQKMSFQTRLIASVLIAAVGIGGLYLWKEHEKSKSPLIQPPVVTMPTLPPDFPPPLPSTTWWMGKWRNANGSAAPALQLEPKGTLIVGLLLRNYHKGFMVSQPLRQVQAHADALLFCVDDTTAQNPAYHPLTVPVVPTWFLLLQKGEQAELFRLQTPPGNVRLTNDNGSGPVFHPARPTNTPLALLARETEKVMDR